MTFASKREQSRIYSSYAEREQIVRIKLRLYNMYHVNYPPSLRSSPFEGGKGDVHIHAMAHERLNN